MVETDAANPFAGRQTRILGMEEVRALLDMSSALEVQLDDEDGFPLAVMDGAYLTAVRTGAAAGLATETLARADASSIGILGTGVVARFSLEAMMLTRPGLGSLKVYSRSPERRAAFAEFARDLGLEASSVATVDEAVRDVDIIVTATNSPTPILGPHHVSAGQLVNAMGIRTEVDPRVIAMCVVVADGREESRAEGKFSVALSAGFVSADDIPADLGEVLAGTVEIVPGDDVIAFDSSGLATQDVDAARAVWELAERLEVGTLVDFGLAGAP